MFYSWVPDECDYARNFSRASKLIPWFY